MHLPLSLQRSLQQALRTALRFSKATRSIQSSHKIAVIYHGESLHAAILMAAIYIIHYLHNADINRSIYIIHYLHNADINRSIYIIHYLHNCPHLNADIIHKIRVKLGFVQCPTVREQLSMQVLTKYQQSNAEEREWNSSRSC